ncbi:MAG: BatA domain-containing protein [Flavobacteriaceae bacterium]|nr:BatA domain-containing protein [Flavobacteriaceae bacterium]
MQFKHPELLYALFLLLIPIFIHLFQLRKFQKVDFTNVAFLKKVTIQTRKSSQLKKWLTLLLRMLALACIIIAFAQPFTASKIALNTEKETVIYIDNSFSMQAKGQEGPLLKRALQQLYEIPNSTQKINWFTNTEVKKNVSVGDFKQDVLSIDYTQKQLNLSEVLLKANQLFSKNASSDKRLVMVSDFQQKEIFPEIPNSLKVEAVQLKPNVISNISIDTAYISKKQIDQMILTVQLSSQNNSTDEVSISLHNDDLLIAKSALNFSDKNTKSVDFNLETKKEFNGKISINEPNILYDNNLFFNINITHKINVLSINDAPSQFIQRLFNETEFNYTSLSSNNLDYSEIPNQNLIVLNEMESIPASLTDALKSFADNGGTILIIPSEKGEINEYNRLLTKLQFGSFSERFDQEKKISQITFDHPLYQDVFEKKVLNFQYPKVNTYLKINNSASALLKFEDNQPFLIQKNNVFVFTAAINNENSNFQSSPLIVPTFYNIAQHSLPLPKLYYTIGEQNIYAVPIQLAQDEIIKLQDSTQSIIPLQQSKSSHVMITTQDEPNTQGVYSIVNDNETYKKVSYNFHRNESDLNYLDANEWNGVTVYNSVTTLFDSITEENTINSYWKWFAIFAVLFLFLEMLVLKYYK